eukprot:6192321-Pleurochrysis_carterae.AAC.3
MNEERNRQDWYFHVHGINAWRRTHTCHLTYQNKRESRKGDELIEDISPHLPLTGTPSTHEQEEYGSTCIADERLRYLLAHATRAQQRDARRQRQPEQQLAPGVTPINCQSDTRHPPLLRPMS